VATVFRGPIVTRIVGKRVQQPEYQQALLVAELAGQGVKLNTPSDFPNPTRKLYPVENRTWFCETPLNLLGQDQMFGAAGQVQEYDWPNPLRRGRQQPDPTPNLQGTTLAAAVTQSPFANYDWHQPQGVRSLRVRDAVNLLGTTLAPAVVTGTPFVPIDWANPAIQRAWMRDQQGNLLETTLSGVTPPVTPVITPPQPILGSGGGKRRDWKAAEATELRRILDELGEEPETAAQAAQIKAEFTETPKATKARPNPEPRFDAQALAQDMAAVQWLLDAYAALENQRRLDMEAHAFLLMQDEDAFMLLM
jgi:hypothetical protein